MKFEPEDHRLTLIGCQVNLDFHPFAVVAVLADIVMLVRLAVYYHRHPVVVAGAKFQGFYPLEISRHLGLMWNFHLLCDGCQPVVAAVAQGSRPNPAARFCSRHHVIPLVGLDNPAIRS